MAKYQTKSKGSLKSSAIIFFLAAIVAIGIAASIVVKNSKFLIKNEVEDLLEAYEDGNGPKVGNYYKVTLYYQFGNYAEMQHKRNGVTTGKDQYFVGLLDNSTFVSFMVKDKKVISKFEKIEDATYDFFNGEAEYPSGYEIELTGKWKKISDSKIKSYYRDAINQLGVASSFDVDYDHCFDASATRSSLWATVIIILVAGVIFAVLGITSISQLKSLSKQEVEIENMTRNNNNPFLNTDNSYGAANNENPFGASNNESSFGSSNTGNDYYNNNDQFNQ